MSPKTRGRAMALSLVAALSLGACAPTFQVHGYVPPEAEVARITPGIDTQQTVAEILGRPTSSGLLRGSGWYYVQSTIESYTYNAPRVVDRTVLAVEFDPAGRVTSVNRFGLEDGQIVNLTTRTTETGGRTLGVLEQLFGNLLNLDPGQFFD